MSDVLMEVPALVFAAGHGTRLRPLTANLPKPLVPFGNRPLLELILDHVQRCSVTTVVVNAHYRADAVAEALERCARSMRMELVLSREQELLGTGGGARRAAELLRQRGRYSSWDVDSLAPALVTLNGDALLQPDLAQCVAEHHAMRPLATLIVTRNPDPARFTPLWVRSDGLVQAIGGPAPQPSGPSWMFTGVQTLSARALDMLPEQGCIIRDGIMRWLAEGHPVRALAYHGPFLELGTLTDYVAAQLELARGALCWPGIAAPSASGIVDPSASIGAGASITDSIIGASCQVAPGVELRRAILWPGTHAAGSLHDVIVTPDGTTRFS